MKYIYNVIRLYLNIWILADDLESLWYFQGMTTVIQ